jgi:DNA repair protein RecO (recombination protein O)
MKIPAYKTEGIIIGRFNSNEFDKLLVVYTRECGKILVKAKSLRKKEAKMKAQLEIFNHVRLLLAKGKNIDTITGAALVCGFPNLRSSLEAVAASYYIAELLDKMIVGPERDERIWQLAYKFFNFLEEKPRDKKTIQKLISRFEYNLLAFLGHKSQKEKKSYLDLIRYISRERIESSAFLSRILAWG